MCRRWSVLAAMNSQGLVGFEAQELGARDGATPPTARVYLP
jgi:hypothetical protein